MNNKLFIFFELDPRLSMEGSYEIGSVLSSTFRQIFWNSLISFFLKFYMMLRAHMWICLTEPNFLGKILLEPNWPKMVAAHFEPISTHVSVFIVFFLDHADISHLALNCSKLTGCYMICNNAQNVEHLGYWLRVCHSLCHLIF